MVPAKRRGEQSWLPSVFNDFFDSNWMMRTNATAPAINVMETEKEYRVEVAAPGMKKEDFNIQLDKENDLVITMEKKCNCTPECECEDNCECTPDKETPKKTVEVEESVEEKEPRYLRREFSYTKFRQTLILPDDVDKEHISAKVCAGVLTIRLPKTSPEAKVESVRTIEVK